MPRVLQSSEDTFHEGDAWCVTFESSTNIRRGPSVGQTQIVDPGMERIRSPACGNPGATHTIRMRMTTDESRLRVDKWLWAARFYKTRSLATEAVSGGKITLNGERAKPAKTVQPGDEVRVRLGPYEHVVIVRGLAPRRGSAREAQALYEETAESRAARERLAEQLRMAPAAIVWDEKGRPTKKDRRALTRFRDRRRR